MEINREYSYTTSEPTWSNQYLWPVLEDVIDGLLLREAGFKDIVFKRVGRVPPLAKVLVALVRK